MKIGIILFIFFTFFSKIKSQNQQSLFFEKGNSAKVLFLAPSLAEISAIALYRDKLLAIQDENGILYELDFHTGKILDSLVFNEKGDFEGLCIVNNTAWALETKGNLWEITNLHNAKNRKINKYKTPFKKENDTEGIAYDKKNNRLLIACKESPYINRPKDSIKYMRAIYAFDLKTKQISEQPIFTYSFDDIYKHLNKYPEIKLSDKTTKKLKQNKSLVFKPTDIAIHPQSKDIYILCGTAYSILVFESNSFQLKNIHTLAVEDFNQAEGITFHKNGDMYISTEAIKISNKIDVEPRAAIIYYYERKFLK